MNRKLETIKIILKNNKLKFTLIYFGYIILNLILNKTYVTLPRIFASFKITFALTFILTNLVIIPFLVSLTMILVMSKLKDLKSISKKGSSISIIAIFGTLLGGACPGCFIGLFPAFIGLFGTTLSLGSLPLKGLEIQFISGIILIISINYLSNQTICKINGN